VGAAVDKNYLGRPDVRRILVESLSEAFRSGSRGPAWEMGLYARPSGFRLEDIRTPAVRYEMVGPVNLSGLLGRRIWMTVVASRTTDIH
jgi:hypothetical protein